MVAAIVRGKRFIYVMILRHRLEVPESQLSGSLSSSHFIDLGFSHLSYIAHLRHTRSRDTIRKPMRSSSVPSSAVMPDLTPMESITSQELMSICGFHLPFKTGGQGLIRQIVREDLVADDAV